MGVSDRQVGQAQGTVRGRLSCSGPLQLPLRPNHGASLRAAALSVRRWTKCSKYNKIKGQHPKGAHSLFLWTPCGVPVCRISAEDSPFC